MIKFLQRDAATENAAADQLQKTAVYKMITMKSSSKVKATATLVQVIQDKATLAQASLEDIKEETLKRFNN